jgi:microcystin degradation protein MlrC
MGRLTIFAAGLGTETNTFSAWRTGRRAFEQEGVYRGDGSRNEQRVETRVLGQFRRRAEANGHSFAEGLLTFAQPSGPTVQSVYEGYRDEILAGAVAAGPVDVILLYMHGAMVATACDDCEGDLLVRLRGLVGPEVVIGVELDPHCHLTTAMVENADAIILMKEYPHDDYLARADELYDLCVAAALGTIRPVSAVFDCRMVGFYPTTIEPMASIVKQAVAAEQRPGMLSVSLAHGFPWGDTPGTGTKVLAIADNDANLAQEIAREVGLAIYDQRERLLPKYPAIDAALEQTAALDGPVVLADTADNAGGGAPSDNTCLLAAMLKRKLENVALGPFWDPVAAMICAEAGVGVNLPLRVGGKVGPLSGDPLDLEVTVRAVTPEYTQTGLGGGRQPLGLSVWIELPGGIDIVICSVRTQGFHSDLFSGLGIAIERKRFVVVKSSHHFHTGFAAIARHVIHVATPGAIQMDFANIAYRKKLDLEFHPRVADPLERGVPR